MLQGQPLHPLKHALPIFIDAPKEGWGAHLNERTARGTWSLAESKLHINHSGLKRVPIPFFEQHTSGGHRQHYSGCLYKQSRGYEVGPSVCPSVENPNLVCQETGNSQSSTHPRPAECDSRQV